MIEIHDLEDHLRSEAHELGLAKASSRSSVRNVHLALAARHAKRAAQAQAEEALEEQDRWDRLIESAFP